MEGEIDPIVTLGEVMEDMKRQNETAEVLLGAQDDSVCTYPEGYKPRQALFSCLTCTPEPETAGICYGCSVHCHADHELVELYTKRSFKCDCGNSKFKDSKCSLYESKDSVNQFNNYNHNYNGKFCVCDDTYPGEKCDEDMLQCEFCEDWFHPSHVEAKSPEDVASSSESESAPPVSFVCPGCYGNHPFLKAFDTTNPTESAVCIKNIPISDDLSKKALFVERLRQRLCKCDDCMRIIASQQCEFLLDEDDDLTKFEQEGKKKADENRKTETEDYRDLVKEVGMDGAINIIGAVNDLKRKMGDFFNNLGNEGNVVKVEDVKKFFADLTEQNNEAKRARMQ